MGYTTRFSGRFDLDEKLTFDQAAILRGLARTEPEHCPEGVPNSYCQWVPTMDGLGIMWDGGEKFYDYEQWLRFIVDRYIKAWGRILSGSVKWAGEDPSDTGTLTVKDGVVTALSAEEERRALATVAIARAKAKDEAFAGLLAAMKTIREEINNHGAGAERNLDRIDELAAEAIAKAESR